MALSRKVVSAIQPEFASNLAQACTSVLGARLETMPSTWPSVSSWFSRQKWRSQWISGRINMGGFFREAKVPFVYKKCGKNQPSY